MALASMKVKDPACGSDAGDEDARSTSSSDSSDGSDSGFPLLGQ